MKNNIKGFKIKPFSEDKRKKSNKVSNNSNNNSLEIVPYGDISENKKVNISFDNINSI